MTEEEFIAEMGAVLQRKLLNPEPVAWNDAGWKILGDSCNTELIRNGYAIPDGQGSISFTPEGHAWANQALEWAMGKMTRRE